MSYESLVKILSDHKPTTTSFEFNDVLERTSLCLRLKVNTKSLCKRIQHNIQNLRNDLGHRFRSKVKIGEPKSFENQEVNLEY